MSEEQDTKPRGDCDHCQKFVWIGGTSGECKDGCEPDDCPYWDDVEGK